MDKGRERTRAVEHRQVFGRFPGLQSDLCDGVSVPGVRASPTSGRSISSGALGGRAGQMSAEYSHGKVRGKKEI